jgi:hypothetical protein
VPHLLRRGATVYTVSSLINLCFLFYSDAEYIESSPSFVSGWINMTADSASSEQTIPHGLQELPLLVQVEAKTEDGWVFSGFGSAQGDDDGSESYGGVVFIYNNENIRIFVPRNRNANKRTSWNAVYLGL